MPKGKPCSAELKARVALEAPQGAKAVGETAPEHGLNPSLARNRKAEAEPAARGAPSVPDSDKGPVFSSAAREGPLASGRARR
ncbi:hypothetical protein, partial [Paratractidigestivibacter sp.]|uniref:hypothetical protein n=1 Tax=Paratractidigestivibacter sp. TaxID=2847316 RepID=UPI002AC98417